MALQFRDVQTDTYTVSQYDSDIVLKFTAPGLVVIPVDDGTIPVGFQVAIESSVAVAVQGQTDDVIVACGQQPILRPFQTGVMVKLDANFWLLGLGTAGGGASVPGPPTLNEVIPGPGAAIAKWSAPKDPGGSPITNYLVEYSINGGQTWGSGALTDGASFQATVSNLEQQETKFRVKALNADGASDPSNVVTIIPDPAVPDGAPTIQHDTGVGSWTITNYNPAYTYTAEASAGTAVITGNKLTGGDANCRITVSVRVKPGGTALATTVERRAYDWDYTPSRYVCTNEEFRNCGPPEHPDGSYYCSCGTLGGCGNPNDCCGWVCLSGYNTTPYYTINAGPQSQNYQSSSDIGGQYGGVPNPPPGEWFKIGV